MRSVHKTPRASSPRKAFNQEESFIMGTVPFDITNDKPAWNQGPGCVRHQRQQS